ncbi:hypothetical protein EJ07DRAFT_184269 [Lizonia empirigonia]|nr:hypothetical protein EJ07DRAFT_184269 [Lizonia empirigonia]
MATDTSRPLQATVEDYFSDDGHGNGVQIEAFTPDPSPGKANVRTKRSNPENLGTDKTPTGRVSRSDRQIPSARYHPNTAPPAAVSQRQQQRVEYRNQNQYDDSESESDSMTESEEEYEQDYHGGARRIMAPPESRPQKGASKRRPSTLRHAHTTPAPPAPESRPRHPQTVVIPDARDSRVRDRNHDPRPDRRSSMSRPPLVPSIKSQLAYDTPQARVIVEGPRSSRRNTLQAYDRTFKEHHKSRQQEYNETRRTNRSSKIYDNVAVDYERDYYDDEEEAEAVARAPLRRRDTDAEARRRPQRPVEVKQTVDAENYINSRRGDRETYADQTYEIAKKKSSRVSGPSEAESSRSRGSNDNGEIRLRIGNDAPVTLSLNGDMEGRTLQLVPIENGMNELVISSNTRGGESIYRSERGSIRGERKAIIAAAEDGRHEASETNRGIFFDDHAESPSIFSEASHDARLVRLPLLALKP